MYTMTLLKEMQQLYNLINIPFTRVSMQYCELLHEWAWYFHEAKVSENAADECNNRDMHNSVVSLFTQSTE